MSKWVIYTSREQSRVVEAESAEAANKLLSDPEEYKRGWVPNDTYWASPRGTHPYAPKEIDWEALKALPKPKYSADELMELTRGPAETHLYYCSAGRSDGESLDWFVEAKDENEALELYTKYLKDGDWDAEAPYRVWEVPPLSGTPCVYNWNEDDEGNGRPVVEGKIGAVP